jgi:P27 family predicted phage terminase small subunit
VATYGPAPKPSELKVLEGNLGNRRIPKPPKYAPLTEHPPEFLPKEGKAEWRRLIAEFKRVDLVQRPDRSALIALCSTWAMYMEAIKDVQERGLIVEGRSRGAKVMNRNPSAQVARDALAQLLPLWARFGMTPGDRSRFDLGKGDDKETDPMLELLTGGGK